MNAKAHCGESTCSTSSVYFSAKKSSSVRHGYGHRDLIYEIIPEVDFLAIAQKQDILMVVMPGSRNGAVDEKAPFED